MIYFFFGPCLCCGRHSANHAMFLFIFIILLLNGHCLDSKFGYQGPSFKQDFGKYGPLPTVTSMDVYNDWYVSHWLGFWWTILVTHYVVNFSIGNFNTFFSSLLENARTSKQKDFLVAIARSQANKEGNFRALYPYSFVQGYLYVFCEVLWRWLWIQQQTCIDFSLSHFFF